MSDARKRAEEVLAQHTAVCNGPGYSRVYEMREVAMNMRLALRALLAEEPGAAKRGIREAFVDGAKWWEEASTGGTMWQSDQHRAADEAEVRFPANEWVMWPLVRRLEETLTEKEAEIATLKAAPAPLPPEVREAAEALRPWLVTNPEVWDRRGLTAVAEITKRGRRLLAALAARRGDA